MFGFDNSNKAIVHFLGKIKDNKEAAKLTHGEVRAYARLILNMVPFLDIDKPEQVKFLLAAMSSPGLPHYDRSFAAEQILKLLEEQEQRKLNCPDGF
ncbi:MAG: hypothetical protein V7K98_12365 [Nostoc sp.]|uniref:hypothetical protein n=1 Tax=Nostoc sp. TaxID=1180 RepID=UPI002FFD0B46